MLAVVLIVAAAPPVLGQAGPDARWPVPAGADITLVGSDAAVTSVRAVVAELLSRQDIVVSWHRLDKLRIEEIVETPLGGRGAMVFVWADVSSVREARIYFRAAAGQRFVIRRVGLPDGVGPLAVEEIAQIVQSVLRALASDTGWALSLSEARVALSVPEARVAPSPPARAMVVDVGSAVLAQLFAPELPVTGVLEASIAALSRPAETAFSGAWGGRLVLGYGFPARFSSGAVGADLRVATLRLALLWEPWRSGRFAIRFGLGGGADRVAYVPAAEQPGATAAAGGTFVTPFGSFDATLRLEATSRLALAVGVLAEGSLQRVHYDAYDANGALGEVLVPHRLRPGVTIGVEVRL